MTNVLKCHKGIGPRVQGIALCASDDFSARYDLDRIRGVFSRPAHKLYGEDYRGRILVLNTAKGGVALGISDQFKIPIRYIGVGESIDKLQIFNKRAFVESLFGKKQL